jgi:hypothetical protein
MAPTRPDDVARASDRLAELNFVGSWRPAERSAARGVRPGWFCRAQAAKRARSRPRWSILSG